MLKNFKLINTAFKDLIVFNHHNFNDKRGSFSKLYSEDFLFKKKKIKIKQINFSLNKKRGTIRGMHYQIGKFAEEKIVTCISGKIFDVVIDLRKNSKTYLKWFKILLSPNLKKSLYVPKGFAHGFQTLENKTEIIYIHTNEHNKNYERTLNPFDTAFNINWPIKKYILSDKDKHQKFINKKFKGLNV
tara:strand:- start:344 stop:904 length:561 start_codon:yes stop_codon:yes gene_type:complete